MLLLSKNKVQFNSKWLALMFGVWAWVALDFKVVKNHLNNFYGKKLQRSLNNFYQKVVLNNLYMLHTLNLNANVTKIEYLNLFFSISSFFLKKTDIS